MMDADNLSSIHKHDCLKCGYSWSSVVDRPLRCGKCNSNRWDEPKTIRDRVHTCSKCEHVWHSALDRPKRCPGCVRPDWDKPRRGKKVDAKEAVDDAQAIADMFVQEI